MNRVDIATVSVASVSVVLIIAITVLVLDRRNAFSPAPALSQNQGYGETGQAEESTETDPRERDLEELSAVYVEFYQSYLTSINSGDFSNLRHCSSEVYEYMLSRYTHNSTYSFSLNAIYLELNTIQNPGEGVYICTYKNVTLAAKKSSGETSLNEAIYTATMVRGGSGEWTVDKIKREKDGGDDKYYFSSDYREVF